jgi:hypothetical protein
MIVIFVFEGPDLAGKSSLADELEKTFLAGGEAVTRMKHGPLKQDALTEYLMPLQDYDTSSVWIIDRLHLGELVYGPLMRGTSRLSMAQAYYIELALRYASRGDDFVSLEQLITVRKHYNELAFHHMSWYMNAYTDAFRADQLAYQLYLTRQAGLPPTEYLGGQRPKVLLLGDRQANGSATLKRPAIIWPFAPWNGTSGHWLFQSLLAAEVQIYDVGILNACDRPPLELQMTWLKLGQPPTIALGLNAKKAAEGVGIPLANHIPHPQFARRFHHKDLVPYGLEIKKVMS